MSACFMILSSKQSAFLTGLYRNINHHGISFYDQFNVSVTAVWSANYLWLVHIMSSLLSHIYFNWIFFQKFCSTLLRSFLCSLWKYIMIFVYYYSVKVYFIYFQFSIYVIYFSNVIEFDEQSYFTSSIFIS